MHKSQHVRVHWFSDDGLEAEPIDLGDYTGNPILLETQMGTRLIYSKFETLVPNRIEWWQHCSLWNSSLDIQWKNGEPTIVVGAPKQIVFEEPEKVTDFLGKEVQLGDNPSKGLGYLPRCHPIWCGDGYLLPLYRENAPHFHGTILYSKDGIDWNYRGTVGAGTRCIQPTIFYDKGRLICLMRNFNRSPSQFAYYAESKDHGKTWREVKKSPYLNYNNSILGITCKTQNFVVWNNDPMGRDKISLATFDMEKPQLIAQLDGYGSYPSACVDKDTLHIVYTAKPNPLKNPGVKSVIKWKQYNLEAVLRAGRKDTAWSGFSQIYSSPSSSSSPWRAVPPKNSPSPGDPSQP